MAIWQRLRTILGGAGYRQEGQQSAEPSSYDGTPSVPVTLDSSLQLSAVWACTKLITESIASLPINVYRIDLATGERTLDRTHPLARLFSGKVNAWQTRQEYFETLVYQLVLMGNDFSKVVRNSKGEVIALIPLMSQQMEVALSGRGGVSYRYTEGQAVQEFTDKDVWQNKLFGNGVVGLSVLSYARNSFGIGSAAERAVSDIYRNGGKPSGVLMVDKFLTEVQRETVKTNFASVTTGNNDRLKVLEGGMKYEQISMSPQDIELLASRRFQIEDIARFFGVPSVLINDTSASTSWGSGIGQLMQGFYKLGLRPYLERYEASMKARLLTPQEQLEYDIEFDFEALLRPDMAERLKMYKEAVQGGVMMPNQARAYEGWSREAGGDRLFMQAQMTPIEALPIQNGGKTNG